MINKNISAQEFVEKYGEHLSGMHINSLSLCIEKLCHYSGARLTKTQNNFNTML